MEFNQTFGSCSDYHYLSHLGRCVLKDLQGAAKSGVLQCLSTVEIKSCHLEIYRLTRDTI